MLSVVLRPRSATGYDVALYPSPTPPATRSTEDVRLYPAAQAWGPYDVRLRPRVPDAFPSAAAAPTFPAQFSGLRAYYQGAVRDLCLVALADAPAGMGAVPRIRKGGTDYAIYLVETSDSNASPIRIRTSAGTKAIRQKT
jgi:hypothetical protein